MSLKIAPAAITAALFISLLGATSASAAAEAGNRCAGNTSDGPFMFVSLANGPGNPPATILSSGVITRWSFSIGLPVSPETILFETLKVFRPTGLPQQLQVIGESSKERVFGGTQTFSTRIPVKAGDLIGALAEVPPAVGTVFCETGNPGDRVGAVPSAPTGSTVNIAEEKAGVQNPVVVFVEPDADNDSFGDETQDKCPQSASTQGDCPTVTVDAASVIKRKGSVVVLLTTTASAPVKVAGTVNLGKGKKAKLGSKVQTVTPGKVSRFTLKFPRKLKKRLQELTRKRSLRLKVTASATDLIGRITTDKLNVRLKGQASG